jgi:transposase
VPDAHTQELRALLRTRKQFVRERGSHIQRLQKTLEDANLKLDSALSDVLGLSGRAMIEALIAGESDPDTLAGLAHRRVKAPPQALREALRGRVTQHHRFLLQLHLQQADAIDAAISEIDREVDAHVEPFRTGITILTTIPGVGDLSARVIMAEIGNDMSRFPTAGHLISWAGLCPKNDESAGKRRSTRMRKGAPWLKTTLIQCACAGARKKGSYLQAQFHRLPPPWHQESDRRRCRLDLDRCLPHARARHPLPQSRPRSLRIERDGMRVIRFAPAGQQADFHLARRAQSFMQLW